MKRLVGIDNGCFDMAPYETRCASDVRRESIEVVVGPETQLSASWIGAPLVNAVICDRVCLIDSRVS